MAAFGWPFFFIFVNKKHENETIVNACCYSWPDGFGL